MTKTALFQGYTKETWVVQDVVDHPANVFFVDSGAALGADDTDHGGTPESPFITLDYAVSQCSANQGDVIYLLPGHAETIADAASSPGVDIAGVRIIGVGEGAARPTLTFTHVDANVIVSAANCLIRNVLFAVDVDSQVEMLDIDALDCTVEECEFREGTAKQFLTAIDINGGGANAANRAVIKGCKFVSESAGAVNAIEIGAVQDGVVIEGNWITGDYSDAAISSGSICTNMLIKDNVIRNVNAGDWAIELTAAATGLLVGNRLYTDAAATALDPGSLVSLDNLWVGNIDQAGVPIPFVATYAMPAGSIDGDSFAVSCGEKTCDGIVVTRATAALPQTAAGALFTITGHVLLKRLLGVVTTIVGNVPNTAHVQINPDGAGADTNISLDPGLDLDSAAVGSMFTITGTLADAMVKTVDIPFATTAWEIVCPPGSLELVCAGSDGGGGRVRWSATYVPLEDGAQMVAA